MCETFIRHLGYFLTHTLQERVFLNECSPNFINIIISYLFLLRRTSCPLFSHKTVTLYSNNHIKVFLPKLYSLVPVYIKENLMDAVPSFTYKRPFLYDLGPHYV